MMTTLQQALATLLDFPGSYSRLEYPLIVGDGRPVAVISDSAYRELIEAERLRMVAELEQQATATRARLAGIEARLAELSPGYGKPEQPEKASPP